MVVISCYSVNRPNTLVLMGKIPMKVHMGEKISVQNLHVFYCEVCAHVPKKKLWKLDKKVMKCIFISYGVGMKRYKL